MALRDLRHALLGWGRGRGGPVDTSGSTTPALPPKLPKCELSHVEDALRRCKASGKRPRGLRLQPACADTPCPSPAPFCDLAIVTSVSPLQAIASARVNWCSGLVCMRAWAWETLRTAATALHRKPCRPCSGLRPRCHSAQTL